MAANAEDIKGFPSGKTLWDVIEKVINAGADEFLSKMLTSPAKLADAVKMILRR